MTTKGMMHYAILKGLKHYAAIKGLSKPHLRQSSGEGARCSPALDVASLRQVCGTLIQFVVTMVTRFVKRSIGASGEHDLKVSVYTAARFVFCLCLCPNLPIPGWLKRPLYSSDI